MRNELDELDAAYGRFRAAKAAFERALSARRKGGDEDFGALARAINDLNLAQHDFSEAAAAVVKESG